MKYLWIPLALGMCTALTQCEQAEKVTEKVASKGDMTFAKNTFEALARGDAEARNNIDWDTFQVMGQNVGAGYVQIPSETEKVNFQQAFVTQFASSFRAAGGTPEFANWRVSHHDDLKTEVAADSGGGTVTITVTERDGKERVSGIGFIR
ncbi:hypothetical protein OKA04_08100 [Luteolibacter flavescens]|uniref:Uncharacterized protein n=1 Tax=Luteolibacter flavescens TaxID=1859460 RepID=A0ABT3FM98_9BACT|nr:hypothetical protein [Luteolibacter flavescens]MCW1884688.1 hypothetical protein [Luteolibacter flavescens]